jgi:hypothetical protein
MVRLAILVCFGVGALACRSEPSGTSDHTKAEHVSMTCARAIVAAVNMEHQLASLPMCDSVRNTSARALDDALGVVCLIDANGKYSVVLGRSHGRDDAVWFNVEPDSFNVLERHDQFYGLRDATALRRILSGNCK